MLKNFLELASEWNQQLGRKPRMAARKSPVQNKSQHLAL
jgi:hypothetical protein